MSVDPEHTPTDGTFHSVFPTLLPTLQVHVVDSSVRTYHCGTAGPSSELTWQGQGRSWKDDNIHFISPTWKEKNTNKP